MPANKTAGFVLMGIATAGLVISTATAHGAACPADHAKLTQALKASVKPSGGPSNGGLDNNMWGAVVDRAGVVCAVTFTGVAAGDQWPGSRAIAIEKANTANALSLPKFALSTANLYAGTQPGGFLFGLTSTNPVDPATMYAGSAEKYGTESDPMVKKPASGVVVFGGGLPLYDGKTIVGALGVSGDTSCGDHNVAWRVRKALGLDKVPAGVTDKANDAIIYDVDATGKSASGYGHPKCGHSEDAIAKEIGSSAAGPK
jgi:uncharacterized protein GlcG (DUF336 family)